MWRLQLKVRDFFIEMPRLCGCPDAERWSDIIGYIYDRELEGGSVWDRNAVDKERPLNRMACAFAFEGDDLKKAQCARLAGIIMLSHYQKEHGEDHQKEIGRLWSEAATLEYDYPEIAATMTADAALAGYWAD